MYGHAWIKFGAYFVIIGTTSFNMAGMLESDLQSSKVPLMSVLLKVFDEDFHTTAKFVLM